MTPARLKEEGTLFTPRTAKWYIPRSNLGNTGADFYIAENPEFGAVFTYHLANEFSTQKQDRKKGKGPKRSQHSFSGYAALDAENSEKPAKVWISISDEDGNIVRHLTQSEKRNPPTGWIYAMPVHRPSTPTEKATAGMQVVPWWCQATTAHN